MNVSYLQREFYEPFREQGTRVELYSHLLSSKTKQERASTVSKFYAFIRDVIRLSFQTENKQYSFEEFCIVEIL